MLEVQEIWKEVKEFEGLYSVSSLGKIKNLKSGRLLKIYAHKTGYPRVNLWCGGKGKAMKVHRIIAQAFMPNPNGFNVINHINSDRTNYSIQNLEWCTGSQNMRHRYRNHVKRKLTLEDLNKIYEEYQVSTLTQLAERWGIDRSTIHKLLSYMHPDF